MIDPITDSYRQQWAAAESRIASGIRTHRQALAEVRVVDAAGAPVPGAVVEAEQTGHAFIFGANCFILDGYDDAELNRRYEAGFLRLFNAATVAMYWRDLEPEPGQPRYAADSARIWRRPPTDPVIAWCRRHRLNINGHTLVWDHPGLSLPDWLPSDTVARAGLFRKRIAELAQRYGRDVQRWDVLNERFSRHLPKRFPQVPLPTDYDIAAFRDAAAYLPAEAGLWINEIPQAWGSLREPYIELIRELDAEGARIDGVGLQFHSFTVESVLRICRDACEHRPEDLFAALDRYQTLGRPIHVSEITLPQPTADEAGEEAQAEMVRNFYRLWFSHPSISAITWWNFADGSAIAGEGANASGLIDRQHRPKAAFRALDKLINEEWKTRTSRLTAGAEGCVRFRGFKGAYRLTASVGGRRVVADANLAADGILTIVLP